MLDVLLQGVITHIQTSSATQQFSQENSAPLQTLATTPGKQKGKKGARTKILQQSCAVTQVGQVDLFPSVALSYELLYSILP